MTAPMLAPVANLAGYRLAAPYGASAFLPPADPDAKPLSPAWWRDAILRRMFDPDRVATLSRWDRYYRGKFDTPWMPQHIPDIDLQAVLKMCRANVMGLVVDATAERYGVTGFRFGDHEGDRAVVRARAAAAAAAATGRPADVDPADLAYIGDADAWDHWQRNRMDAEFPRVIHDSVKLGAGYLMVAPNPTDPAHPFLTREDPNQVYLAHRPGFPRGIAAAVKAWQDDWTGERFVTLYQPDLLYKWQTRDGRWVQRQVPGERWPAPNPLGEVPLYEIPNYPEAVSELDDVMPDQDRINKTLFDRLMDQDFGAFPAKWALGFPAEDKNGNPTEIKWGRNRMLTNDVSKEQAAFGQFAAAPLEPLVTVRTSDVRGISARKRIPAQYLLGEVTNVNGATLKAAEVGLVAKTVVGQLPRAEEAENAMRAVFRLAGDQRKAEAWDAETIWRNPEFRTEGELVDALTKMATLGVPREALWERWGATPQEIRRWSRMLDRAAARGGLGDLAAMVNGEVQPPADATLDGGTGPAAITA